METCGKHEEFEKKLRELTNNRKFWQRVFDSRYSHFLITGIVILACMFVGWTVNEIYAQKANEKENKKVAEVICEKVNKIDEKIELMREKRDQDQKNVMDKLLEIQKQIKK